MSWRALAEGMLGTSIDSARPMSGGCVSEVHRLELDDGRACVAKCGPRDRLDGEADGLEALSAPGVVRVPRVLGITGTDGAGVLLLEALDPGADPDWVAFGRDLAALHEAPAGERYGFERDNHLGATPQPNGWLDDWVTFNRTRRHGPLVERVEQRGLLSGAALDLVRRALDAFEQAIPKRPKPSLLHGDLWSGNALPLVDGGVAVIDPAVSIGDGLADIAMMQLFGGFPDACFEAYRAERSVEFEPRALAVYRLHHLLNHMVLFGAGYRDGVLAECRIVLGDHV